MPLRGLDGTNRTSVISRSLVPALGNPRTRSNVSQRATFQVRGRDPGCEPINRCTVSGRREGGYVAREEGGGCRHESLSLGRARRFAGALCRSKFGIGSGCVPRCGRFDNATANCGPDGTRHRPHGRVLHIVDGHCRRRFSWWLSAGISACGGTFSPNLAIGRCGPGSVGLRVFPVGHLTIHFYWHADYDSEST